MQQFFITSSGTEIGKTLVMTTLCWQLRQSGKKVTALKPVITGFDSKDEQSDTALIMKACGLEPRLETLDMVSPWRFAAPLAPSMAATKEGKTLAVDKIAAFCRDHAALADVALAEGAGGVMAPLTASHTMLDLIMAISWPVILVGGTYLGSISHTLTALDMLRVRGLVIKALILSESAISDVSLADTAAALEKFMPTDTPIAKLPRQPKTPELWKTMPPISWVCT